VLLLGMGYAKEIFQGLKRSLLTYWPARPAVSFLIMTYAALNSHNTSWGTKGLTRPDYLDAEERSGKSGTGHAPRKFRKRHFDRFRVKTVVLMLAANVGFYAFAASRGWMESFTGLRLVLGLVLAQVGIAYLGRIAIALKERRQ
jgi:Na+-transporting NADH:ubiquinone oxidoreductase subunit NqrB